LRGAHAEPRRRLHAETRSGLHAETRRGIARGSRGAAEKTAQNSAGTRTNTGSGFTRSRGEDTDGSSRKTSARSSWQIVNCRSLFCPRLFGPAVIVHNAMQALFECCGTEVDEQSDFKSRDAQVGQHLLEMDSSRFLNRFHLHNDAILDQQIDEHRVLKMQTVDVERYAPVDLDTKTPSRQFAREQLLADRFEQPWSETLVYPQGGIDDLTGNVVDGSQEQSTLQSECRPDASRRSNAARPCELHSSALGENLPCNNWWGYSCARAETPFARERPDPNSLTAR